jgi:hypothetical protein
MFFTSAGVLLIGLGRWYYGMSTRPATPRPTAKDTTSSSLTSKMASLLTKEPDDDADADTAETPRRRQHSIDRASRPAKATADKTTRSGRPAKRTTPSRSRHTRPPETEIIEPVAERPRRQRSTRQAEQPPPAEPRRRPRKSTARKAVPPPAERRANYERPERRRRYDDYEPLEPHGTNGNGTHHPVSRVRYRGGADDAENRTEYRTPRRSRRDREAESWEYDI